MSLDSDTMGEESLAVLTDAVLAMLLALLPAKRAEGDDVNEEE